MSVGGQRVNEHQRRSKMRLVHYSVQRFKRRQPSIGVRSIGRREGAIQGDELAKIAQILTLRVQGIGGGRGSSDRRWRGEVMISSFQKSSAHKSQKNNQPQRAEPNYLRHHFHTSLPPSLL